MDENALEGKVDQKAEGYFKKYRPYMESLEKSPLGRVKRLTSFDYYALGKMLESWETVVAICEANGSMADLGILPRIAQDVITVSFGTSPMSLIASVQPIDEEVGTVYYKRLLAHAAAGNMSTAEEIVGVGGGMQQIPNSYSAAKISSEDVGADDSTLPYSGTLANTPVRPRSIKVTYVTALGTFTAEDTPTNATEGTISGPYVTGTIVYATGVYTLTFVGDAPTSALVDYQVNFEAATDIRQIDTDLTSKEVRAMPYALKGTIGLLKRFQLMKRFGSVAEDELAMDLTNMLNVEQFGDMVRKLSAAADGIADNNTNWDATPPSGVAEEFHRRAMKFYLAKAEKKLVTHAGRGTRSFYIAGATVCEYMSVQPGWQQLYDGAGVSGAHLYGSLDGVPVIRIPTDTSIIAANKAIIGYKGTSTFEAPAVFAPYMPLMVTAMLPMTNPLMNQRAAAAWVAIDVLVEQFLTTFTLTNEPTD